MSAPLVNRLLLHSQLAPSLPFPKLRLLSASASSDASVEFLVSKCNLPLSAALSAARTLHGISDPSKAAVPLAVLSLFRSHGLSQSHIARIVASRPSILLARADATLAPKLRFLSSFLPSPSHLPDLLALNPSLLSRSLHHHIQPLFSLLRLFLDGAASGQSLPDALLLAARRYRHLFTCNIATTVAPNIELLVSCGVPAAHIAKLLATQPGSLALTADRFARTVDAVAALGFRPDSALFVHAVRAVNGLRGSTWDRKMEFFRSRLGWYEEEFKVAFQRAPFIVLVSDEKMSKVVDFLLKKVGLQPSDLSLAPKLLMYSLEKRLLPRFSVFQVLESRGLLVRDGSKRRNLLRGIFTCSEQVFLDKYIVRYIQVVPDLVHVYHGSAGAEGS